MTNEIPKLNSIISGAFTLIDAETKSTEERAEIFQTGAQFLTDFLALTEIPICQSSEFYRKRSDAWKELAAQDLDADWNTFNTMFDSLQGESAFDPRLDQKALAIYQGPDLTGVFYLYNIKITGGSDTLIEATAHPAPGISVENIVDWAAEVKEIMEKLLEETLPLSDGRGLDLAWKFPASWLPESLVDQFVENFNDPNVNLEITCDGGILATRS